MIDNKGLKCKGCPNSRLVYGKCLFCDKLKKEVFEDDNCHLKMLNELHNRAMEKLKTDKSRFNSEDVFKVVGFVYGYPKRISKDIIEQIKKDIGIYKKYDAVAMWVGIGGLIEYEPEFIKGLVQIFGIEE